ncbi:MAG: MFS transporter [Methanobacterium sp. ERen5]|nr:MAG: MFS transporter [Methanobacterium sp. ERen5]
MAICLVNFMFNFYIGMVNITLPTITEFYHADVITATWISNIYLLTLTISVIFLGRIGGLWSRKKFFIAGTLLWVVTSLLCFYSNSPDTLILLRAVQGFAAGFMASVYYAILDKTFPKKRLGFALGLLLIALSGGYAVGPLVGGYIAAYLGWQYIFLAVIPFGLLSVVVYLFTAQKPQADHDFDLLNLRDKYAVKYPKLNGREIFTKILDCKGAILQAAALFTITITLIMAQKFGFNIYDVVLLILAMIFGGLFVWVEAKHEEPLFRFTVFRSITFSAYITGLLLNYIILYMALFILPFYLQKVIGVPVNVSGTLISVVWFAAMIISLIAGGLADKIGVKPLAITAGVSCLIATILIHSFQTSANWYFIIGAFIILGLGYGFYQSPNNKMLLSVIPVEFKTQVSAMMTLTKNLGSVLGNAFAGLIISTTISQSALSSKMVLTGSQATDFMNGFESIFLFGAVLSVILLISTFDLEGYIKKYSITQTKIKDIFKFNNRGHPKT